MTEDELATFVVSPLVTVMWRDGRIELRAAGAAVELTTVELDVLGVLHAFRRPRLVRDVVAELSAFPGEEVAALVSDLFEAEILIEPTTQLVGWDLDALAFHRRSRSDRVPVVGAPPPPAIEPPRSSHVLALAGDSTVGSGDLTEALGARRSRRSWPRAPIAFEVLSRLLWLSARNRDAAERADGDHVSRPYPSGGAAYSLELTLVIGADAVSGLEPGVYRYLPEVHSLDVLSHDRAHIAPFLDAATVAAACDRPPVTIVITSRFGRQASSYDHLAYGLVLKEVGCLFQTMYLVGEHLDIAVCALGGGSPDGLLHELLGTDDLSEPVVGEFMLGPRA